MNNFIIKESKDFEDYVSLIKNINFGKDHDRFILSMAKYCGILEKKLKFGDYRKQYLVYDKTLIVGNRFRETLIGTFGLYNHILKENELVDWLSWFGVKKQYQKKGFGSMILSLAIKKLKEINNNAKNLYLFTDTSENFYIKNGFILLGTTQELIDKGISSDKISFHLNDKILYKNL